jgi:hypothetical protein
VTVSTAVVWSGPANASDAVALRVVGLCPAEV